MTSCLPWIIVDHASRHSRGHLAAMHGSQDQRRLHLLHELSAESVVQASFSFKMMSIDRAAASVRLRIGSADITRSTTQVSASEKASVTTSLHFLVTPGELLVLGVNDGEILRPPVLGPHLTQVGSVRLAWIILTALHSVSGSGTLCSRVKT